MGCDNSEKIDPKQATIDCGIMVRLITGEVTPSVENLDDMETVISGLATTSYGPIRNVAKSLLPSFPGSNIPPMSADESEAAFDEFKSFCLDYTVD